MSVPAKSRVKGPIGQTVLEVLGTMMTPDTAAEVLRRALERSARSSIPENAERVRELAEGELRAAVIEMVGVEVADSFLTHLLVVRWRSGVRTAEHLAECHPHGYWMHAPR